MADYKKLMIGSTVRFIHLTKRDGTQIIHKGIIREKLLNNNLLLEVVDDGNIHSLDGTLCNRNVDKLVE